jgi:hypothetical protein
MYIVLKNYVQRFLLLVCLLRVLILEIVGLKGNKREEFCNLISCCRYISEEIMKPFKQIDISKSSVSLHIAVV